MKILASCRSIREFNRLRHVLDLDFCSLKYIPQWGDEMPSDIRKEILGTANLVLILYGDFSMAEYHYLSQRNTLFALERIDWR